MEEKKIEPWFVSLVSKKFHGIEPTTFLPTNDKKKKNAKQIWTAKFSQV